MNEFNQQRVFHRNDADINRSGDYVLYWMQVHRRFQYNFAFEHAVNLANRLDKPLLVYEGLVCDYPWSCERFHVFFMEGMREHRDKARTMGLNYYPFVEKESGAAGELFRKLAEHACCVVTDEFPVFIMRENNRKVSGELNIPYITVDSNGLIPLKVTDKAPYNAYFFRRTVQRNFLEYLFNSPKQDPVGDLENRDEVEIGSRLTERFPPADAILEDIPGAVGELSFDKNVPSLEITGTRQAALGKLGQFIRYGLPDYAEKRNDPDANKTSGLSPWLHFGLISTHEIVRSVLERQPEEWNPGAITYNEGSRDGFFNGDPNITQFLDELVTWREVGFHFAHHEPDYDKYESLPDWALATLDKHRGDPREWIYTFEELDNAETHDDLWNAAQRQLRREGVIHNYLRMLWGKKVIEWTPNPETALKYLIELNNKYAIDGRDPNSYSGIFWCFGRFDRAWQERPIYGKVRYMTSESTRRKVKLDQYLEKYREQ